MFAIVGAGGKVGGTTVRELRRRGLPVRAVVRDVANAGDLAASGCEVVEADIYDAAALARAFRGASAAQLISPMHPQVADGLADAAAMADAMATAVTEAGVGHALAISDYGAHLPSGTGITMIFRQLEERLGSLGAAVTFLRSAEHMENWARMVRLAARTGAMPLYFHPRQKALPTVSAYDVGLIAADLLAEGPASPGARRVVHAEGPHRPTVAEVLATVAELAGREVAVREVPRDEWFAAMTAAGTGESYACLAIDLYDAHNGGRIEPEPGGEVRHGATPFPEALRREAARR